MRGSAWPRYRHRAGIPAHVAACWTNAIGSGAVVPATRNRRTGPLRGLLGGRVEAKTGAVRGDSGAKRRRHNEPILQKAPETLGKSATGWLTEHPVIGPSRITLVYISGHPGRDVAVQGRNHVQSLSPGDDVDGRLRGGIAGLPIGDAVLAAHHAVLAGDVPPQRRQLLDEGGAIGDQLEAAARDRRELFDDVVAEANAARASGSAASRAEKNTSIAPAPAPLRLRQRGRPRRGGGRRPRPPW